MKGIKVTVEGTTPLLMNKFHDAAQQAATNGTRMSIIGSKGTPHEQAVLKLYTRADGAIVIPQPNIFRAIIDAGTFFKAGKSKVTTQQSSLIPACVDLPGLDFLVEHRQPWSVDSRPVVVPATKGRILCYRPRFDDWRISFEAEIDEQMISPQLFREIVDAAGKRIGLGDFRPARKGPFGKFVVIGWVEEKSPRLAA